MTYMRHLGQPARTMDVASGLLEQDDTQELGGEEDDEDPFGESSPSLTALEVLPLRGGGDKFSFRYWVERGPVGTAECLLGSNEQL
ncbi:hypothetical protein DsansV1_C19g0157071 [Dioscorea sansibarensis]